MDTGFEAGMQPKVTIRSTWLYTQVSVSGRNRVSIRNSFLTSSVV